MENIRKLTYDEVEDIVLKSNPIETEEDKKGAGFWLFEKEFKKAPKTYLNENSPWKPVYYGLFDNDNETCIGLVCLTYNYQYGYKNYPHVLIIQSTKKGAGIKLLFFIYRLVQKEGYNGITLYPLTKELEEKYKKLGFSYYDEPRMQKTFKNYINDSIFENEDPYTNNIKKKIIMETPKRLEIDYYFGKNGGGISNELHLIGKDIEHYSTDYFIVLSDPYFDVLDDTYFFKIIGTSKESNYIKESENYDNNFIENMFIQLFYSIKDANETKDSDIIFSTIRKVYNLLENEVFNIDIPEYIFDITDEEAIGNQLFNEIKKSFDFLFNDTEYLQKMSDDSYIKYIKSLKMFLSDFNMLCYSILPNDTYRKEIGENILNENYLSGAFGDPTFSTNTPNTSYTPGYSYTIRNLDHSLEGHRQKYCPDYTLIHVGSYVSGKNKDGNIVYGRIYRIIKDSDGYIKKVYIFDKNAKLINVDIDTIISVPNGFEFGNKLNNLQLNTKIPIAESIKHNGPKELSINGKKYLLTLNEGKVVVCELKNKQINSLTDLYDIDIDLAKRILNKL